MKKRVTQLLLTILMFILLLSANSNVLAATNHTVAESMSWLSGKVGTKVGSGQCVALIKSYYSYLGVNPVSGNGCDYATNSLPSGWSRVKGGVPQKGDILVYTGAKYGHVAIYAGGTVSYHQNMAGQYVEKKTSWSYNKSWYSSSEGGTKSYWGYIRPNWKNSAPAAPTIKSHSDETMTSMKLTWSSVSGATKYKLQWRKAGDSYDDKKSKTVTGTSQTVSGLEEGKLYWFRVYAINDAGSSPSSKSYGVYLTPNAPKVEKIDSTNSLKVSWSNSGGNTKYELLKRKSGEEDYTTVKKLDNTYSYTVTGLTPGAQYYFKIKEYNNDDSSIVSGRSESNSNLTKLNRPTVNSTTANSVSLSWNRDSMDGAYTYTYIVRRRISGTSDYVDSQQISGTSYTDTGLSPNTSYVYYIDVYRTKDGNTSWCTHSEEVTTTTTPQGTTDITIDQSYITLTEGETFKLNATVYPLDATDKTVHWGVTDANIASVAWDGTVTALRAGDTNITATTAAGQQAICSLHVNPQDSEAPTVSNLHITNLSALSFNIECDLSDNIGVKEVNIKLYGQETDKSDFWITVPATNGHFSYTVDTSQYYGQGTYWIDLQAFDGVNLSDWQSTFAFNAINEWENTPLRTEIYNGHIYRVYDINGITWNGASVFANEHQGHLVTIADAEENEFVRSIITKDCFIGATDWINDGEFIWNTGEPFVYSNWKEGEPNNQDGETVIEMYRDDGTWNDFKDSAAGREIVLEYEPIIEGGTEYNRNTYQIYNFTPDYETARRYCESIGGHLATVTSQEENDAIAACAIYDKHYYLGASDAEEEGVWKWLTEEEFSYTNWLTKADGGAFDEPSNLGNQNFLSLRCSKWDDIGNPIPTDTIGFICEFENDDISQNIRATINAENGKVGDVITVNISMPEDVCAVGGSFNLIYDNTKVELTDTAPGALISDRVNNINDTYTENAIRINFAGTDNILSQGGIALTAKFKLISEGEAIFAVEKLKLFDIDTNHLNCSDSEKTIVITSSSTTPPNPQETVEPIIPCFTVDKQNFYAEVTNTGEEQTVAVIIAEYDGETLKNVSMENITFAKNEKKQFDIPQNGKIFVWNSLSGMYPMDIQ